MAITNLLLLWLVLTASSMGQNCYTSFKGNPIPATDQKPCGDINNGFQSCCVIGDVCEGNSICHFTHPNPTSTGVYSSYYLGGCTDPFYQNTTACTPHCITADVSGTGRQTDAIFNNTSNLWSCCGATVSGPHCDQPLDETFQAPGPSSFTNTVILSATPIYTTTASSTSLTTTITSASTSTSTPSATDASSSDLSTGAKAGIGAGVPIGVLLIASLLAFLLLRRRRQLKHRSAYPAPELEGSTPGAHNAGYFHPQQQQQGYYHQPSIFTPSTTSPKYGTPWTPQPSIEMAGNMGVGRKAVPGTGYGMGGVEGGANEIHTYENDPRELGDGVDGAGTGARMVPSELDVGGRGAGEGRGVEGGAATGAGARM